MGICKRRMLFFIKYIIVIFHLDRHYTMNKTQELSAKVVLINDRLHFSGTSGGNPPVSIDYIPPLGDNLGYTSLELLLLSLSSCLGSALLTFLRRMGKHIEGFSIEAQGIRKENHPTSFRTIKLDIHFTADDVSNEEIKHLCTMAEEQYCPVWDMIRGNVSVEIMTHKA